MIPTTILFHPFWYMEGAPRDLQTIMFLKNLAILGGLILMLLHGGQGRAEGEESLPPLKLG